MSILKFPTYAYFGTEQKPMTYALICDQTLFDKFKAMQIAQDTPGALYHVEGKPANNPVQVINEWFGTQIMGGMLPYYIGLRGNEPADYTDILDVSLSSVKSLYDDKYDKLNFIKNFFLNIHHINA